MKIDKARRSSEAQASLVAEPEDDMLGTVGNRPGKFSPRSITAFYAIDPSGWHLCGINIRGPRVLKKTERELGSQFDAAHYGQGLRQSLDEAPQWAREFATANHPDRRPAPEVAR
jgi:hypothetical protein